MGITQAQKYEILEHKLPNGAGLEEILKKCLEILMKSEREIYNENYLDYSNDYRYRKISAVLEELYGKKYSTSQVSRMFDYARRSNLRTRTRRPE